MTEADLQEELAEIRRISALPRNQEGLRQNPGPPLNHERFERHYSAWFRRKFRLSPAEEKEAAP